MPLSGMVHVVSIFAPEPLLSQGPEPPPIKLHFSMAGVLGTGPSGNTYVAANVQDFLSPEPPPISQGFELSPDPPPIFPLEGTGACTGQAQLPVNFSLLFDQVGHLLPGSNASLECVPSDINPCHRGIAIPCNSVIRFSKIAR